MDNLCEYCNHEMDYESNYVPYGSTSVDAGGWTCCNDACLGDKEPACWSCGNYAWQVCEDVLTPTVNEQGKPDFICLECLKEAMTEELAA